MLRWYRLNSYPARKPHVKEPQEQQRSEEAQTRPHGGQDASKRTDSIDGDHRNHAEGESQVNLEVVTGIPVDFLDQSIRNDLHRGKFVLADGLGQQFELGLSRWVFQVPS